MRVAPLAVQCVDRSLPTTVGLAVKCRATPYSTAAATAARALPHALVSPSTFVGLPTHTSEITNPNLRAIPRRAPWG